MISFMKYNINIMYREDIASYTRKNREKSIFYLTHYTYRYILKSHHINIFKPLSKPLSKSLSKPLSNHFQLLNIYGTTIELLSNVYQTSIEYLLNIYRTTSNVNWTIIEPLSNNFQPLLNIYRTTIEHLSDHYFTTIEHLSNIYRTSIEPHQTSIEHLSNIYHYQTSIKLLLNIYQILIVCYITIIYRFNRTLYNHYLFSFINS